MAKISSEVTQLGRENEPAPLELQLIDARHQMSKSKVLIHVVGGIAYWSSEGDVDVVLVDEDNIKAGDPPVQLSRDWEVLAQGTIDTSDGRIVQII